MRRVARCRRHLALFPPSDAHAAGYSRGKVRQPTRKRVAQLLLQMLGRPRTWFTAAAVAGRGVVEPSWELRRPQLLPDRVEQISVHLPLQLPQRVLKRCGAAAMTANAAAGQPLPLLLARGMLGVGGVTERGLRLAQKAVAHGEALNGTAPPAEMQQVRCR